MRSNGGVCSFGQAAGTPIGLLESGPVAGVTAAAELGRRLGARHVLALDIGGTTAKTAAVRDGQVRVDSLHHIGRTPVSAGYPVQAPTVEIVEIGAGGGSVAWADDAGGLHVGPRSAGAEPGPGLLRPGRHRAHADRREPRRGPDRPRLLPRRHDEARHRTPRSARWPGWAAGWAPTPRPWPGA